MPELRQRAASAGHVAAGYSPLPHLDIATTRMEVPAPTEGPVLWRERWDFILTPVADSAALGEAIQASADLQFDLPDRLTIMQECEVTGVISGRVMGLPLTGPQGAVLSRGTVTLAVGHVPPVRALSLELCWAAPDGRYFMLSGHGNGVTEDSLNGIQLALRGSWRNETAIEAMGQSMTFLLTRVMRPSQLPPPPPPPDGLWKRLTGKFRKVT